MAERSSADKTNIDMKTQNVAPSFKTLCGFYLFISSLKANSHCAINYQNYTPWSFVHINTHRSDLVYPVCRIKSISKCVLYLGQVSLIQKKWMLFCVVVTHQTVVRVWIWFVVYFISCFILIVLYFLSLPIISVMYVTCALLYRTCPPHPPVLVYISQAAWFLVTTSSCLLRPQWATISYLSCSISSFHVSSKISPVGFVPLQWVLIAWFLTLDQELL